MLPGQVAAKRTPIELQQLADALAAKWRAELRVEPRVEQLAVLLAQSALETGRWRSCFNWNLGNVKAGASATSWYAVRCSEILNGKEVFFDPPHPACRFVAYGSLDDGAAAYWRTMRRGFASAWPAVEAANPRDFVRRLKSARYFTAAEGPYAQSVATLWREFVQRLSGRDPGEAPSADAKPPFPRDAEPPPVTPSGSPLLVLAPLAALGLARALARTGAVPLIHERLDVSTSSSTSSSSTGCTVPTVTWFGYGKEKAADLDRVATSLVNDATANNKRLSPDYLRGLAAWVADWRRWYKADRSWWAWNSGGTMDKLCRAEDDLAAFRAEYTRQTSRQPSMPASKDDPVSIDVTPSILSSVPIVAFAALLLAGGYLVRGIRR